MSQEKTPINKLPEDQLSRVLELLDRSTLKNCALVCKKWSERIAENSAIMKKLPMVIEETIPNVQELIRKYHTIKCWIDGVEFLNPSLKTLLIQQGCNLRVLELESTFAQTGADVLSKILESLPKLEVLKFSNSSLYLGTEILDSHSMPRQMKSVVLNHSDLNFLRLLENTQIASLKVDRNTGVAKEVICYIIGFLAAQNELEEIAFRYAAGCSRRPYFEDSDDIEKLKQISFPLKRLAMYNLDCILQTEEKMKLFLNRIENTLEELELGSRYPEAIFEMIFKNFLKLKILHLDLKQHAPAEQAFYRDLPSNHSVQKLILTGTYAWFDSFQGLVGKLPNIEELIVEGVLGPDQMHFIANNLNLKSLKLRCFSKELLNGIRMPSVQSLIIGSIDVEALDWGALSACTMAFRNIEKLSVCEIYGDKKAFNSSFKISTEYWQQLKHIKLGRGFVAEKSVFDQMLSNCKNLKILEIGESAFARVSSEKAEILRDFKSDHLIFIIHSKGEGWYNKEWKYGLLQDDSEDESTEEEDNVMDEGSSDSSMDIDD